MDISVCGLICNDCPFYGTDCPGCYNMKGQPFWTKEYTETGICPLYECAVDMSGYASCGDCAELPCSMFQNLKDPNISEKEHKEAVEKRVGVLRDSS